MSRRRRPSADTGTGTDRTRVAAYAVAHDDEGRILLCHISPAIGVGDVWTLPGGGLDFGEHPDAAAIRELEEETGLAGEIEEVAGVFSHVYRQSRAAQGRDLHFLGILYHVRIVSGELRDETDGSTDTAAWLSREELGERRLVEIARYGVELAFRDRRP